LRSGGARGLRGYVSSLRAACAQSPPPFGLAWYGEMYRRRAANPSWVAASLVENAAKEGDGARDLWRLAARTADAEVAELIRRHAVDESRHALVYLAMLETVFPGAVSRRRHAQLTALSPHYRGGDRWQARPTLAWRLVLDELIQMNVGEIRTRINLMLLAPVLTVLCPARARRRLRRMLGALMKDEARHICYTARLIESAMRRGEDQVVRHTMARRLAEFNRITRAEVGGRRYGAAS
jgi:rubrerythrin